MQYQRGIRLFWPIVLIGVGSILLLTNLGVITGNPWAIIFQLWPVLLIALGLEILLGGSTGWRAVMSALLGLALVGGILWVLIAQPAIPGLNFGSSNLQTTNIFQSEVGYATSARCASLLADHSDRRRFDSIVDQFGRHHG